MAYALVTGASSGIGLCYAEQLARDYGMNLLLVSNQQQELSQVASDLHQRYGIATQSLYINLAQQDAAERVFDFCKEHDLDISVLVNNAGMLVFEQLDMVPVAKIDTMVMLHVLTTTKLCRLFAEEWVNHPGQRRYILNMSSMTAWMAMPGIQTYNATKSYVLNFSRALWYEMRRHDVHVLAVTPGSVNTGLLPFPETFARLLRVTGITMEPQTLVKRALKALFHSWKKQCMPGAWNTIIVPIINHLPDWLVFAAMKRLPMFR